jgi:Mn2+/Fe2+ NRAMP family transporter
VFRVLSLALLGYVASMVMAHPDWRKVGAAILHPGIALNRDTLSILVAMIGTSLSAYLFTWQSNQEVEEKVAAGQVELHERKGTTEARLQKSLMDVFFGMFFSALVMYSIIIATAATLFASGHHDIQTAADAAKGLEPIAGHAATLLFSLGIVGVGFLAIPVMTTGAAYDVCQSFKLRNGLDLKLGEGKAFYGSIAAVMAGAILINLIGINPMKALVFAGIVQGFSTPPLMLLIMLMTSRRKIMGDKINRPVSQLLGWATTLLLFAASGALVWTSIVRWLR